MGYRETSAPLRFDCHACGASRSQGEGVYTPEGEIVCRGCDAKTRTARVAELHAGADSPRVQLAQGLLFGEAVLVVAGLTALVVLAVDAAVLLLLPTAALLGACALAVRWWRGARMRVYGLLAAPVIAALLTALVWMLGEDGSPGGGRLLAAAEAGLTVVFVASVVLVGYVARASIRR